MISTRVVVCKYSTEKEQKTRMGMQIRLETKENGRQKNVKKNWERDPINIHHTHAGFPQIYFRTLRYIFWILFSAHNLLSQIWTIGAHFLKFKFSECALTYILPIGLFSVLYNVSRFFELRTVSDTYYVNGTSDGGDRMTAVPYVKVESTEMRKDPAWVIIKEF